MKKIYLLLLLCLVNVAVFAQTGPSTPVGPGTGFSGTSVYCLGATATPVTYNYTECGVTPGPATGVLCSATWYYNTTNTTTISGSTVTVSGPTAFMSAAGIDGDLPPFTPLTGTAGTYYYFCVVTWTDPGTCPSPFITSTFPVTIHPVPTAIAGSSTVCEGSTMTLSDATSGGTWASSNSATATVGSSNGVVTGVAAGVVDITYTITATGCNTVATITVNPIPAVITGTTFVCMTSSTLLSNATSGGVWASSNAAIATVDAGGLVTPVAPGTVTISYTLSTSCTRTTVVTINPTPNSITGTTTVCTGLTTALVNSTPGGTWSSSDVTKAIISSTGVVTGVAAGTATITYQLATGCYRTTTVTVNQSPAVITGTLTVCAGSTTALTNSISGGIWSSSNPSVATIDFTTGVATGVAAGTSTISYTLSSGCRTVIALTVYAAPNAILGSASVCMGSITTLTNTVSGGTWTSMSTGVAVIGSGTGVVTPVSVGTSTISYTLGTGCSTSIDVTVNPLPGSITGTGTVCVGSATTLANASSGGTWTSGSTGIATIGSASGIVSGIAPGTSNITYTLSTGCRAFTVVTVYAIPAAIGGSPVMCEGFTTNLSNSTAGGTWSSSDMAVGTISTGGVVTGLSAGTSVITYQLSTGCYRTLTITVNPLPAAIGGTLSVCVGATTALTNASSGGTWASSAPGTAAIGSATGIATGVVAGTTTITYRLPTGCISTGILTVNPLPASITGTLNVCIGLSTTLSSTSTGGTWSSSNAAVAAVGSVTGIVDGISLGNATITYTIATGCFRTVEVTVNAIPAAISGSTTVCVGSTTPYTNATAGGTWSSSNTAIGTVGSATGIVGGIASGTTNITYRMATGCIAVQTITVNALPAVITGTPSICPGFTRTLSDATSGGVWSSTNPAVGTIDASTGVVTGIAPGVTTISYTIGTGCARTVAFTVNTVPAAIGGTLTVCLGLQTTLSNATGGGTWSSSTPSIAAINPSNGVVTATGVGTATVTYTLSTGCYATDVVTVNPLPASIAGAPSVCISFTTTLTDATSGGVWSSNNPSVASVDVTGVVTGVASGITTISYTIGTGCYRTHTMSVNPLPSATSGTLEICYGAVTVLSNSTSGGSWSTGNPAVATVGGSTGVVTSVAPGTANITYTLFATGCIAVATVTVDPLPAVISGSNKVCLGLTTTLTNATSGGNWASSNATVASIDAGGVVTGNAIGTATITYTLSTGCYRTMNITVNALPGAIGGGTTVCVGATSNLTNPTAGGTWVSNNSAIATVGSTSGVLGGVAAGNTTITYTVTSTGCSTTATVTVDPLPGALTGTTSICMGGTTTLASTTGGGTWSSSNAAVGTVDAGGVVTSVSVGTTTISYTLGTGCRVTAIVTVNALPGSITGITTVCEGATTTLASSTSGGAWTSGAVSVATIGSSSGIVTGGSAGTAPITYTLGTGCSTTTTVTVNAAPPAITGTTVLCAGTTSTLANAATGGIWSSSSSAIASINFSTGVVTGNAAGTATITYTLPTGCRVTTVVTVNTSPTGILGSLAICEGNLTTLTSSPTGGTWTSMTPSVASIGGGTGIAIGISNGTTIISYTLSNGCASAAVLTVNTTPGTITGTTTMCAGTTSSLSNSVAGGTWSSSNGGVATVGLISGVVTGNAAGTANITYTLTTGCRVSTPVTVIALPAAITGTASVCEFSTTTLADATVGGTWSSMNTAVATIGSTTGVVTGASFGTALISYTVGTGCARTIVVTVNPLPAAIGGPTTVCVSSSVTLTNATSGGTWTSSSTPVATIGAATGILNGTTAGTATITYRLGTGCLTTTVITVNPLPATLTGPSSVCQGSTITLASTTTGGTWVSLNTAVATVGTAGDVFGVTPGTSVITYTIGTGCYVTRTITVNSIPGAITGTMIVCVGSTTTLSNAVSGGTWIHGSGAVAVVGSTSGIVTGVGAGTGNITYTLSNGCTSTAVVTVDPIPNPITGTLTVCQGSITTLSTTTTGGTWSSLNTAIATVGTAGDVLGIAPGITTISYTLPTGCYRTINVTVNALPSAITGTFDVCVGSTTSLSSASPGGTWSSSSPGTASVGFTSGVVTGSSAGNATITYRLSTGCLTTQVVTVNPLPATITGTASVCVGLYTTLSSTTPGGNWTSSNMPVATAGTAGDILGVSAGTAIISYTLPTGCYRTSVVTVYPLPAAIAGTLEVCPGTTTTLTNATTGGTWSSSNPANATVIATNGVVTGVNAGTTLISYRLSATGCISTAEVTVNPLPAIITGSPTVCVGLTTTLSNASPGGAWTSTNTVVATVGTAGDVLGLASGTSTIIYTLPTGCTRSQVVTVNALPAVFTGPSTVCVGSSVTLGSSPSGGTWSSSVPANATVGSATGYVSGLNSGTTDITYTVATGCIRVATITVDPLPAPITGSPTTCFGTTTTLFNATSGGVWSSGFTGVATIDAGGVVTPVAPGTAPISYTLSTGCKVYVIFTVSPLPAAITGTLTACEGATTTLASSTAGGTWSSSNVAVGSIASPSSGVVTAGVAGTADITYTLPSGCFRVATLTVNAAPGPITGAAGVCLGSTTTLANAVSGGLWSSSNTTVAPVDISGVVTGNATGTATITYALGSGCRSTRVVTVSPLPASITGTLVVCEGANTALGNLTGGGTWSSSLPAIGTINATSGLFTGISFGTTTITYMLGTGCYRTATVTVNQAPSAIAGTMVLCAAQTTTLTSAPTGGAWNSSNVSVATITSGGVVTAVNTGTSNITYTLPNGCSKTAVFTVNTTPSVISGSPIVCQGSTTALVSSPTTGTWTSSVPTVAIVSTTGLVSGIAPGTSQITYTLPTTGCTRTVEVSVTPTPAAITASPSLTVCTSLTTTLSSATPGGAWNSSTPSVATVDPSGVVTGMAAGTARITYTLSSGCSASDVVTVTPSPSVIAGTNFVCEGGTTLLTSTPAGGNWSSSVPGAAIISTSGLVTGVAGPATTMITYALSSGCYRVQEVSVNPVPPAISGLSNICVGATVTFTNAVSGGNWTSSNTAAATVGFSTGIVTGIGAGTTTISYTLSTGCRSTLVVSVDAQPNPITGITGICVGTTSTLNSTTPGGAWSSANTSIATVGVGTGIVTGVTSGTVMISYTTGSGCWRTTIVTVNPLPNPIFGTFSLCVGSTTVLGSATTGGTWSSSSTGVATVSATSGTVGGISGGFATITYKLSTGCIATQEVTVNALPSPILGVPKVCVGGTTILSNATFGGVWGSGNPSVATVDAGGVVTGGTVGTVQISYTASGCSRVVIVTVNPNPAPIVGPSSLCVGTTATMTSATSGGAWASSSPTVASITGSGVVTAGSASGTTTISYTVSTGCMATMTLNVNDLPPAITGGTSLCVLSTTTLSNTATGGTWSSSNPSVGSVDVSTGVVTGNSIGTATITYSLATGCRSTVGIIVNGIPAPITGIPYACEGNSTTLSTTSTGGVWSSSNATIGTISTTGTVEAISAGTTTISYTFSSGCARTLVYSVNPQPTSISGPAGICVGFVDTMHNGLTGGIWSSTNPSVASIDVSNGAISGLTPGVATISYTLGTGCFAFKNVTVHALPGTIGGPLVLCEGGTVTLTNPTAGGTWSSSDPSNAPIGVTTGVLTGGLSGYYTITYTLGVGCSTTADVTVNPTPPTITWSGSPAQPQVCEGSSIILGNTIAGGTWSSSNPSIATVGVSTGILNGILAGTATITYTLGVGCATNIVVSVSPMPAPITGIDIVCQGNTTTFNDAVAGGTWTSSNSSVASIVGTSGVITGIASGSADITYTMPGGCYVTKQVTVNASPAPIPETPAVCAGLTLTLTSATSGGLWSSSNASVAPIGLSTGVVSGITVGTSLISYTLLGTGCATTVIVTVNPSPAPITGSAHVCEGATTTLSSTTIAGTWTSGNMTVAIIGSGTGVVSGLSAGTAVMSYTLPTGCYATMIIGVNPAPAPITGDTAFCEGTTTTLSNTTGFGVWSSSVTSVATVGSSSGVVTGASDGTSIITYTLGTGCYTLAQVTVDPAPAPIGGLPHVCVGSATFLTSPSAGGDWTSSIPTVATVDPFGSVVGLSSGTSEITYTLPTTGCMASVVVTVEPTPDPITGTTTICQGSTSTLSSLYIGGIWSSSNAAVGTIDASTGVLMGTGPGIATITYTSPVAGCITTTSINVLPLPLPISGPDQVCVGSTITLTDPSLGGMWVSSDAGTATIGTSGVVTGIADGTVTMSYTNPGTGCAATLVVTVNPLPNAGTITGPGAVCLGNTITLANVVTGGIWTSADTDIVKIDSFSGVAIGEAAGLVTITYTYTNMCGSDTTTATILVNPLPEAGVISGIPATCIGFATTLTSTVSGGTWSHTNPSVATLSATGVLTGIANGLDTIIYTVTTVCGIDTAVRYIQVFPHAPVTPITIHTDSMICSNVMYQNFGAASVDTNIYTYYWTAINASVYASSADKKNALVTFPNPGAAIVMLTTQAKFSGCVSTDSFTVAVGAAVAHNPEVKYYNSELICTDNTADSYQWGYDDFITLDSTIIKGAIHQYYYLPVPEFATKHYWVMTNHDGCVQKSYYNTPLLASWGASEGLDIRLFPNPTNSRINIVVEGLNNSDVVEVKLYDMTGRSIYTGLLDAGRATLNVAEYPSGMYSIVLTKDGAKIGAKIFVKN